MKVSLGPFTCIIKLSDRIVKKIGHSTLKFFLLTEQAILLKNCKNVWKC